jgi:hypothetical protein
LFSTNPIQEKKGRVLFLNQLLFRVPEFASGKLNGRRWGGGTWRLNRQWDASIRLHDEYFNDLHTFAQKTL